MESLLISSAAYLEDKKSFLMGFWDWMNVAALWGASRWGSPPWGNHERTRGAGQAGPSEEALQECCLLGPVSCSRAFLGQGQWGSRKSLRSGRSDFCPQLFHLQVMQLWASHC